MSVRVPHTDKLASFLLVLLAIGVFIVSQDFPSSVTNAPGPAFFPQVIAVGIAGLAFAQFVFAVVGDEVREHTISVEATRRVVIPIIYLVMYVLVLPLLGFFLTTIAFLVGLMYYSGARNLRISVPLSIIVGAVLQYVFVGFLHIPLPAGVLPVWEWLPLSIFVPWGVLP
jgi:putative tricarboxylic transport membrane protein